MLVFFGICKADQDGCCYAKIANIADKAGLSETSVWGAMTWLARNGWLMRARPCKNKDGSWARARKRYALLTPNPNFVAKTASRLVAKTASPNPNFVAKTASPSIPFIIDPLEYTPVTETQEQGNRREELKTESPATGAERETKPISNPSQQGKDACLEIEQQKIKYQPVPIPPPIAILPRPRGADMDGEGS